MIRPQPFAFMPGTASRVVWNAADRLIAMIASHLSGGKLSTGETCWMPALLTRMSGRAELVGAAAHHPLDRRRVGQVGAVVDRAQLGALALDVRRVAEAVDHQLGAFGGERLGDGEADARGRAGDEGDFVFENHDPLRNDALRSDLQPRATVAHYGPATGDMAMRLGGEGPSGNFEDRTGRRRLRASAAAAATCSAACCRSCSAASASSACWFCCSAIAR